ncbi:MAG: MFS transporter [Syntrophobacteraceae bacterium]|nr:MFS transporter [Syntrophobacteraceae bacterium]
MRHLIDETSGRGRFKNVFRALRHRNYRLFFIGQGLSLIGTWTQQVALSWLVYTLTGSTVLLGTVAFCSQVPMLLLGPWAGVCADRFDRKKLLLWTQGLAMAQAFVLAGLVLSGLIRTYEIIALSVLIGAINAFDIPIRQSFVMAMVEDKEDLGNAIALSSAMFNCARLIGPSVAGILISAFGEGICFLINGVSFVPVLIALQAVRAPGKKAGAKKGRVFSEFGEAVVYARRFEPILAILAMLAVFGLAGSPYIVLLPAVAKNVLHGGAYAYGFLMSSSGLGAIAGTIYLASRRSAKGLIKAIPAAMGIFGTAIAAFAFSHTFVPCVLFMFLAGFSMMIQIASSNTIIQTVVEEDKRGRIMGLYAMSLMGVMPFGSLLAGSIAGKIGVESTLLGSAALCIVGAAVFAGRLPRLGHMLQPMFSRIEAETSKN